MHGVSEVIAIILILMITISLAGLAYMFMSTTMSDVTSSAGSTVDTTTTSMLTSFTIESIDVAKVYVRNTGQNALANLSVYVNDEPAVFNMTPSSIVAGAVGTITIYSFIPDGGTVKVTSPSGFSASKVADECSKAVGCWKFDENEGFVAYDSSPYGNDLSIHGAIWTNGRYGKALSFDGINDHLDINEPQPELNCDEGEALTLSAWFNAGNQPLADYNTMLWKEGGCIGYSFSMTGSGYLFGQERVGNCSSYITHRVYSNEDHRYAWHNAVLVLDRVNGNMSIYVDGHLKNTTSVSTTGNGSGGTFRIGTIWDTSHFFNGTIDEIRIYNRAIY